MPHTQLPLLPLALAATALVSSCGLNTGESIDFDNPFCQEVDLTFSKSSSSTWTQEGEAYNVIRDEYELRTITIEDSEGLGIEELELTAPDGTKFYYPARTDSTERVFTETISSSTASYTVSNIRSRSTVSSGGTTIETLVLFVDDHLGTWDLSVTYRASEVPSSLGSSTGFTMTYDVCFEYDE